MEGRQARDGGLERNIVLFLTVVIVLGAIGATSPSLVDRIKLGLDLKGGFEILYTAGH